MSQDNASFTFLHRIEEVELNIEDGRWQSALALALTLPDICGGIAFPEIVKRYRDGRAVLDRNQRPTRDVGNQYIRWFDTYAAPFFKVSAQDISPYICGERCWQLRCEYLHQNKGFANTEDNTSIRFHLGVNCGTSVCQLDRISSANSLTDIRIDIEQFCRRMCRAARAYYEAVLAIISTQTAPLSVIRPKVAVMAIARLVCGINRLAQIKHLQSLVFARGFGHKKRAPIHPQCGANKLSMYTTIFYFICHNSVTLKTSAFFD